jgi:hypothetical protein
MMMIDDDFDDDDDDDRSTSQPPPTAAAAACVTRLDSLEAYAPTLALQYRYNRTDTQLHIYPILQPIKASAGPTRPFFKSNP